MMRAPAAVPACLQHVEDLMLGCAGDGSCVQHSDVPDVGGTTTKCYANGVKVLQVLDTSQVPPASR
jgi:hypothetical protein